MQRQTIGIVGGGQLGRMLTLAALPLGFDVVVVDPVENSPAAQVGAKQIVADLYDKKALAALAKKADFITVEIEHLDTNALEALAARGAKVNPAPATVRLIQDKFAQKEFLHKARIPIAPFAEITDENSAAEALKKFGGKMLIKTRHGAYDGRGNMLVKNSADIKKAFGLFEGQKLYAEKFIPFYKELAVMVARDFRGNIAAYPVVETIHARNICLEVRAPASIDQNLQVKAKRLALKVAKHLQGAGVFGIEMFLTKNNEILVNEMAPRVHNSGHYTIEANRTSQFEQHIRAIAGLPLGDTTSVTGAAVMINVLGERNGPTELKGLVEVLNVPHTSVHIYGKSPTKVDRKMGHITSTGKTLAEAQRRARLARKQLNI